MLGQELRDRIETCGGNVAAMALVEGLYLDVDRQTAAVSCECRNCKTCCDFQRAGHRLYVTGLELAHFAAKVGRVLIPSGGACPYLDAESGCTVRQIRPLGCRTYFCREPQGYDAAAVTERQLGRIKRFCDREGLPYVYVEWLEGLRLLADRE